MHSALGRCKAVSCTQEGIIELLRTHSSVPDGCHVEDAFTDPWTKKVIVILRHPDFAEIPEGEVYPEIALRANNVGEKNG